MFERNNTESKNAIRQLTLDELEAVSGGDGGCPGQGCNPPQCPNPPCTDTTDGGIGVDGW